MSDDEENDGGFEHAEKIGNEIVSAFSADKVAVKLLNGGKIEGSIVGFSIKKRPAKGKKPASCHASVSIQTAPGVLEIDCHTVASVDAG
jgi:hypothetical protein